MYGREAVHILQRIVCVSGRRNNTAYPSHGLLLLLLTQTEAGNYNKELKEYLLLLQGTAEEE